MKTFSSKYTECINCIIVIAVKVITCNCNRSHNCTALIHTHTHTHAHTHRKQNKASHIYQVNQHYGTCPLLRCNNSVLANPPGARLVAHRRLCHVKVRASKPHLDLGKIWIVGHVLPKIPNWCCSLVGCFPSWLQVTMLTHTHTCTQNKATAVTHIHTLYNFNYLYIDSPS